MPYMCEWLCFSLSYLCRMGAIDVYNPLISHKVCVIIAVWMHIANGTCYGIACLIFN